MYIYSFFYNYKLDWIGTQFGTVFMSLYYWFAGNKYDSRRITYLTLGISHAQSVNDLSRGT